MSNQLKLENSFYLQTHKDDPIYWYPWAKKSLEKAKKENKSIFLSIGQSSSHWSTIMDRESFQKEPIIELLNERFIAIKVDADEHPEVAKYYQKVHQLMNRSTAGFPISIFMTENLEPFYAASYIATEAQKELLGFEELLRVISKKYITDNETLSQKGHEVLQYINPTEKKIEATKLDINILKTIKNQADHLFDKENGGFGKESKFPNISTLELLLDSYELTEDVTLLNMIIESLDAMAQGGLHDKQNGGFYNYTTDSQWEKPNMVKTLYTNALLSQLYLRTYYLTVNIKYRDIALETIEFMITHMMNENQLFSSRVYDIDKIDKNILMSLNAMAISALFQASIFDKKYQSIAIKSLDALFKNLSIDEKLFHSTLPTMTPTTEAFLEDYAYLGELLINAYQTTLDELYLVEATKISNKMIEQFYAHGKWKFSNGELTIDEDIYDSNYASSLSIALSFLMSISSLVDANYKKFVFKTLELNSYNLMRQPLSSPKLTTLLLRYLKDDIVIKSNEESLMRYLENRYSLGYPFILFKTTLNENVELFNANSCFATESTLDNIKPLIKSRK